MTEAATAPAPAEKLVSVVAPDGTVGTVPASQLAQVADAGGDLATNAQMRKATLEAKYHGGNYAKGAELEFGSRIAGGLRGFTGGLSDKAAVETARAFGGDQAATDTAGRLTEYDEAAPIISKGSEISGIVAPMFAGRVPGMTGRLAGGIPGLVSEVGRAGEGVAAGILGRGATSTAGRVLQKAIPAAVAGGLEGAAYGAGSEISESALGDHDLNAERLIASAKHGAFWGAATSGGLSGIGALRGATPASVERLASHEATAAEAGALRAEADGVAGGAYRAPGVAAEARPAEAAAARPSSLASMAGEAAEVSGFKALGGTAGQARAAMRNVEGGPQRIASDFFADLEAHSGKSRGTHDVTSAYDFAVKRTEGLGERLGNITKNLDERATGIAPDVAAYAAKVRKEIIDPGIAYVGPKGPVFLPGAEAELRPVMDHLAEIESVFGEKPATFQQWHKSRVSLDKTIKFNATTQTPATDNLRRMRGMMEGELETSMEKAAKSIGGTVAEDYTATKGLYQSMKTARDMLERKVATQEYANRSFSLGDMMGALKGAIVGGIPGAVIGGVAGHVVRTRGDFIAADLLHRASKLEALGANSTRVNAQISSGVRSLVGGKVTAPVLAALPEAAPAAKFRSPAGMLAGGSAAEKQKAYTEYTKDLASFQSNPALATKRMTERLGDLPNVAPKTAAAVTDTVQRGASFLFSKMPPPRIDPNSLTPHLEDTSRVSPYELSKFARYAQAVDDPLSVLKLANGGELTRDHVEAVKAVYPGLYEQMRTEVLRSVQTATELIPYDKQVQLGTLLDIPTNRTMVGSFIKAVQVATANGESEEQQTQNGGGATSPMGHVEVDAKAFASAGDNIESGR